MSTLILKTDNFVMVLLTYIRTPNEDKNEDGKELFYLTLEDVFIILVGQVRLILGGLNKKVGKE